MRRAILQVTYNGTDISADVSDRLISFSYNDNKQGEADDIEITVHNRDGIWTKDWYPDKGAKLTAGLKLEDWVQKGDSLSVNFGTFAIDELSASSGGSFTIKAIAAVCEKDFTGQKRNKTWENVTAQEIISSIAANNGLQLIWNGEDSVVYQCVYQIDMSDAAFIFERASNIGLKVKVSEEKLYIYEDSTGSSGVRLTPEKLASYSFRSKTFGIYDSCDVSYLDPVMNQLSSYIYVDPAQPKTKVLVLDRQAESVEDAKRIAKTELKAHNEKEITASIDLLGEPNIWSGQDITLNGFGVFSGTYIIESVRHGIDRGGYKTSAELHLGVKHENP